jgi:coproporphyrinogen III oxidase
MEERMSTHEKKQQATTWFQTLRDQICTVFEAIERTYADKKGGQPGQFTYRTWERAPGEGGGTMGLMKGQVFEKVGVNFSEVFGKFSETFAQEIPGADRNPTFWASGISLVAHMKNPLVSSVHMNTRMITTEKLWFGGGADLTPTFEFVEDTYTFHQAFKKVCDAFDPEYYPRFKKWCDDYFYLPHRGENRGVGGIFYDYLNSGNWDKDFQFTQGVGHAFLAVFPKIVNKRMFLEWTEEQKEKQRVKRGRYAEFNLLYDRGTRFGLQTNGNTDAILMSLPPEASWP